MLLSWRQVGEFRVMRNCSDSMKVVPALVAGWCALLTIVSPAWAQRPELVLQTAGPHGVSSLAFSPDGRWLATTGSDEAVRIWDSAGGRMLRRLPGFLRAVTTFSADGASLLAADEKALRAWDVTSGRELRTVVLANPGNAIAQTFSPDRRVYATGGDDMVIRLWDVSNGRLLRAVNTHAKIYALAFGPDGRILASGGFGKRIQLWNADSGAPLPSPAEDSGMVYALAFNAAGTRLASGGADKTVKLWDVRGVALLQTLRGHAASVHDLRFNADGSVLASGDGEQVRIWDVAKAALLRTLRNEAALGFSPDGGTLAVGAGNDVALVDALSGAQRGALRARLAWARKVTFSADGKMLAYTAWGKPTFVKLWSVAAGRDLTTLKAENHLGSDALAFSPDGRTLLSGASFTTAKLWDTETGTVKVAMDAGPASVDVGGAMTFTPDGQHITTVNSGPILYFESASGRLLGALPASTAQGNGPALQSTLTYSPDGRQLATAGYGGIATLWDVASGRPRLTLTPPGAAQRSPKAPVVAFSADNRMFASAGDGDGGTIRLWNTTSGALLRSLRANGEVTSLAFTPDGRKLVSGGRDAVVRVWNADTGAQLRAMNGSVYGVFSVATSPDGRMAVTTDFDAGVKLWDLDAGRLLAQLVSVDEDDWLVITPDGLFDGSPAAWSQVLWRFGQNINDVLPAEAFFNEYFYPGLLADLLAGRRPTAAFDFAARDRRQPVLRIASAAGAATKSRETRVRIEVQKADAGARDLRLFRNGALVKAWRGDVLQGKSAAVFEAVVPLVAGENRFTAYAFNRDNIKSSDATTVVTGDGTLARPGRTYVLAVGVNEYADADFNLRYAVADARAFAAEWQRQQQLLRRYVGGETSFLSDRDATKANILQALGDLAKKVQPEDALVVYFAGHGVAHEARFYLIPHDLGYAGRREQVDETALRQVITHSISDRELELALEKVDAGQLLLVIDACNSGQALEAQEKRRGPMNSQGLAQLAYEKGMSILTAAQSYQAALEAARLGHGLLTYALVEEGLVKGAADSHPRDGTVLVREWLDFATQRVPGLQREAMLEGARAIRVQKLAFVPGEEQIADAQQRSLQRPRLFYRREKEANPLVVARPGGAR